MSRTVYSNNGDVVCEHDFKHQQIPIQEFIDKIKDMQKSGATHVELSVNYGYVWCIIPLKARPETEEERKKREKRPKVLLSYFPRILGDNKY